MPDLSNISLADLSLEEGARPNAPPIGEGEVPSHAGRHLAAIHRGHLMEIGKARQVLRYAREGKAEPQQILDALTGMTLTENMKVFGSLCGNECRMLQFHHNAEEFHMFPELEGQKIPELTAVVAKLRLEHEVVHELLDRLTNAAIDLINDPTASHFDHCAAVFGKLEVVVQSHFSYEETELRDALDHLVQAI